MGAWLSRTIVAFATRLVPAADRPRFRREWQAEIAHAADSGTVTSVALVRRALHSLRDAVTLRGRRLRRRDRSDAPAGPAALLDSGRQDVRFALRSLWHARGFTVVAVVIIALGIAATTTIFSFVNGILLRPLPFAEPEQLVTIWPETYYSSAWYEEFHPHLDSYEAVAAYTSWEATWLGDEGATRVVATYATAGLFDVLRPTLVRGTGFRPGDDRPGSAVAVITESFWRQALGGREDIVGAELELNGSRQVVLGVVGDELRALTPRVEVVLPWVVDPEAADYFSRDLKLIGRLRDGVGARAASEELQAYLTGFRQERGLADDFGAEAAAVPLHDFIVGGSRATLLLLFGAVAVTLLIAASNVANLLLARALTRRRELAVRVALGAGGRRLVRQMLTETTLLALLAAPFGLLAAVYGLRGVASLLPADTPRLDAVGIDATLVLFAIGVAAATGAAVGILPALQASRADPQRALAGAGSRSASAGGRESGLRRLVVLSQVALAVTLVAGAGLLVKSYWKLTSVDPGFRAEGLVTVDVEPGPGAVQSAAQAHRYFEALSRRLLSVPGIEAVTTEWKTAFREDGGINGFWRPEEPPDPGESPLTRWRPVEDNYLAVTGMRLREGRFFGPDDEPDGEPVAVLTVAAARTLFGDASPLGELVVTTAELDPAAGETSDYLPARVVGVVEDLKLAGLDRASPGVVYRPYRQIDATLERHRFWGRWITLRTAGPVAPGLATGIRSEALAHDPTALFADFLSMRGAIRSTLAMREAIVILLLFFATTAIVLGAVGVYGVMALTVRQRQKEIGIRLALGASRRRIIRGVLGDAARVAGLGAVVGLGLSLALTSTLRQFLFEVEPTDPWILALAALTALAVATTASLLPALRAAAADPARTLGID